MGQFLKDYLKCTIKPDAVNRLWLVFSFDFHLVLTQMSESEEH